MDLSFLRSLVENPGPFLSVYLDTSGDDRGVDAQVRQARWRDLREELGKEDDEAGTLDAMGAAFLLARPAGRVVSTKLTGICAGTFSWPFGDSSTREYCPCSP